MALIERQDILDLTKNFNLEINPLINNANLAILEKLPKQTKIFLPWHADQKDTNRLAAATTIFQLGHVPVPHIVARLVRDVHDLRQLMENYSTRANVCNYLYVAGDEDKPLGKFNDTLELLSEIDVHALKLDTLYFAAYPDGHPHIPASKLQGALQEKSTFGQLHDMRVGFITQACTSWDNLHELSSTIFTAHKKTELYIGLVVGLDTNHAPVFLKHIGRPRNTNQIARGNFNSDKLLFQLAQYSKRHRDLKISGIHFYCLGDLNRAVNEILAIQTGSFYIDAEQQKIRIELCV